MNRLWHLQDSIFDPFTRKASGVLPLCARFLFAATLLTYFWNAALTKIEGGLFGWLSPSIGAYTQIFPRQIEAVGYDAEAMGLFPWLVVLLGTWAEFILPALIVLGLFSRIAALGMIIFIGVQSLTDYYAHGLGADPATVGAWFDGNPSSMLMDQRMFWVFPLLVILSLGGGWLSVDRIINRLTGVYDLAEQ